MSTPAHDLVQASAVPWLPAELWVAIFEQFLPYDVHIFKQSRHYRYDMVHELQRMQLVCSTWRDLIRPLTYRHLTFDRFGPEVVLDFLRFFELMDPNKRLKPVKASWIQTLWLRGEGFPESTITMPMFTKAFTSFLPRMSALQELSFQNVLEVHDFEIIARYHAPALKRLAVTFRAHDLPRVLPLMKYFTALQDWFLTIHRLSLDPGPNLDDKTDLPNLRLLKLVVRAASNAIVKFLSRSAFPKLAEFWIETGKSLDLDVLSSFMARHGGSLTTFGFDSVVSGITTAVFPHTPRLTRFGVGTPVTGISESLQGLPISVTELFYSRVSPHIGIYVEVMKRLVVAVEQLSHGSALQVIRFKSHAGCLGLIPYTALAELPRGGAKGLERCDDFVQGAARLLALGFVVVNEEGLVLTDFLNNIGAL